MGFALPLGDIPIKERWGFGLRWLLARNSSEACPDDLVRVIGDAKEGSHVRPSLGGNHHDSPIRFEIMTLKLRE